MMAPAAAPVTTAPLTAAQLLQGAQSMAAASTAGPLAQLASQIAAQNAQTAHATKAVAGDFKGLGNFVNQAGSQVGQVGQNLNGTLGQIASQENGQLSQISQQAQDQTQRYLPTGDTGVGDAGMQSLISALAQQQGTATENMAALRGAGASEQAGYQNLIDSLKGAYQTQGQQDLANIQLAGAGKVAGLEGKVASLAGKQSALTNTDLFKLRQQEEQNNYHQALVQLAGGKLGVEQQNANTTAANDAAKNRLAAEGLGVRQQQARSLAAYRQGLLGVDQKNAATRASEAAALDALRAAEAAQKEGKTPTPLSAASNNTMLEELGSAVARARLMQKAGDKPAQIEEALRLGGKSTSALSLNGKPLVSSSGQPRYSVSTVRGLGNPALVQAVLEVAAHGAVSHKTWVDLHNLGIHNLPFKVAPPVK